MLMKIIALLAATPGEGRDPRCLNSSFPCFALNQESFPVPRGAVTAWARRSSPTSKALSLPAFPSCSLSILGTPPLLPRHLCPSRKGWSSSLTKAPARRPGPGKLPRAGQNFPRSKLARHSLLLQTLPGPNPHPAEACLICPLQPLTSAGPSLSRLNPWLSTASDLLHPSMALTSPLPPRALPPHSPGQLL